MGRAWPIPSAGPSSGGTDANACTCARAAPPRSSYTGDIKADNGVIHMLNEVIYPGWSESAGGYGSDGDAATRA